MAIVLVSLVKDDCVSEPNSYKCADLAAANKLADEWAGPGYVGCVKVKDKIKRVF